MNTLEIEQRGDYWMVRDPGTGFLAYGDTRAGAIKSLKAMYSAWVDRYALYLYRDAGS